LSLIYTSFKGRENQGLSVPNDAED